MGEGIVDQYNTPLGTPANPLYNAANAGAIADLASLLTSFAELLLDTDNLAGMLAQLNKIIFDGNGYLKIGILNGANQVNVAPNGMLYVTQSTNNASVPTGVGNTVVKASAGSIASLVVTTAGTGAGNVTGFDSPTTNAGTPLFSIPATVSVGQQFPIYGWAKTGITVANVLNGPVFTVFFS